MDDHLTSLDDTDKVVSSMHEMDGNFKHKHDFDTILFLVVGIPLRCILRGNEKTANCELRHEEVQNDTAGAIWFD